MEDNLFKHLLIILIMGVRIRKAKLSDVKDCYNLSKIRELLPADKDPIPLSYFKDIVGDKRNIFLVAEENKKIIGYSTADLLAGRLVIWQLLAVHPKYQNKGIGKQLAREIHSECKRRGYKYILGYAPQFNKKTIAFHKSLGFKVGEKMFEILKVLK